MKALKTLARLAKAEVAERQRALAEIEEAKDSVRADQVMQTQALTLEQDHAGQSDIALFAYGRFAARVVARRRDLQAQERNLEQEAAIARDALSAAHVELKKLETLIERRAEAERLEAARLESKALDETAGRRASRR